MAELNNPSIEPDSRSPRCAVKLGGTVIKRDDSGVEISREESSPSFVAGCISWEADNNAYRGADTFNITLSISALESPHTLEWFADQSIITAQIYAKADVQDPENYSPDDSDNLIYGEVDDVSIDIVHGKISLHGRDLTAKFIDTKSSEHFANKTSSQIAELLADRHGLGKSKITKTTKLAGSYYQIDHDSTTQMQSEWDLLSFLADQEGFLVYVTGKDLYFGPMPKATDYYVIEWQPKNADHEFNVSNVITMEFTRALHISKGFVVEVHSWNEKHKKGFSSMWPRNAKAIRPGQALARQEVYRYTFPNLTQEQANQRAQKIYAQIAAHEMKFTCYMPGDDILDCSKVIQVRGTGTAFDQLYYPESVMRSMSISEGYRMNIRAKNTSPDLDVKKS